MKELISICKQREDNTLLVIDEKRMTTYLDEEKMETFVMYKKKRYTIQGNIYMLFIIIE